MFAIRKISHAEIRDIKLSSIHRSVSLRPKIGASAKTLLIISNSACPLIQYNSKRNTIFHKITHFSNVTMANFFKSLLRRTTTALKITEPMKMSLVVRTDLKMSPGKTGAQCAHAAIICYTEALKKHPELAEAWINSGQSKVVLRVGAEVDIKNLSKLAYEKNLINGMVRDAGRTEVKAGTITVLGIGPDTVAKIDEVTKKLKTY